MEQDDAIRVPRLNRPKCFFCQDCYVGLAHGPRHHTLRCGHQADHPAGGLEVRPQHRIGETKAHNCLPLAGIRCPHGYDLIANGRLSGSAQSRVVVERFELIDVDMHCSARGSP